jgi:hypothetical protein
MMGPWKQDGPAAPHKVLNAYINTLTTFSPLGGDQSILETEPDIGPIRITSFHGMRLTKVNLGVLLADVN